jgi:hypothetical protein
MALLLLIGIADHAPQAGASSGQIVFQVGGLPGELLVVSGELAVSQVSVDARRLLVKRARVLEAGCYMTKSMLDRTPVVG